MNAESDVLIRERARQVTPLLFLTELLAQLDLEATRYGERLDGLHAAVIGAREDPRQRKACKRLDKRFCLLASAVVEWPPAVVAFPLGPMAGASVSDQQQRLSPRRLRRCA